MNWTEARKRLLQLASGRTSPRAQEEVPPQPRLSRAYGPGVPKPASQGRPDGAPPPGLRGESHLGRGVRAASISVASGKGGVGKSVVASSLAVLLARRGRTLIFDADFGVGNAHIFQDVSPPKSIAQVVEGSDSVRDVVVPCSENLDLVAAGSGMSHLSSLSEYELHLLSTGIEEVEFEYEYLVLDSAAGVSGQTLSFAGSCDLNLIVTTPDLTAMTDAYAFFKVLMSRTGRRPLLLVNRAKSTQEAREVIERMLKVCQRFLGITPIAIGSIPEDARVGTCINQRGCVVLREPESPAAKALELAAVQVLMHLDRGHPAGLGRQLSGRIDFAS